MSSVRGAVRPSVVFLQIEDAVCQGHRRRTYNSLWGTLERSRTGSGAPTRWAYTRCAEAHQASGGPRSVHDGPQASFLCFYYNNSRSLFLGGFVHFCNNGNVKWTLYGTVIKFKTFTLSVSSNSGNVICSLRWPWTTDSCSAFDQTGWAQLSQKVVHRLAFQFLLGNFFAESSGRKSFRFPHVLI